MSESTTNSTLGDGKVSKGGLFDYFKDTTTRTPTSTQSAPSGQSQLMVAYKKPKLSQYVDHNNKCSFMVECDGKMHPCGAKTDKHNVGRHFRDKHADYQGKPICQLAPFKTRARRQLIFFFATSTAPIRLIENEWFKKLLHGVPDFIVPCRRTVLRKIFVFLIVFKNFPLLFLFLIAPKMFSSSSFLLLL